MSEHLMWRVFCEAGDCCWIRHRCESREQAVRWGRDHAKTCARVDDEWAFRVQGIRVKASPSSGSVLIGRTSYPPHEWEPKLGSRNKSLPCGRCGIYRYVHGDTYEVVTLGSHPRAEAGS